MRRMIGSAGLLCACVAAFSMALGYPHVTLAAGEPAATPSLDQFANTPGGQAALARAGLSARQFKAMLAKLTPDQRKSFDRMVLDATPKARLAAKMVAAGYTIEQANERIGVLTPDEIARLADDPSSMNAGTSVGGAIFILSLILVALAVAFYFMVVEEPGDTQPSNPPPAPEPAPAQ